jgi:DUF4097 and DUF4098 domain-containing protein YvlB
LRTKLSTDICLLTILAVLCLGSVPLASGQAPAFRRKLDVGLKDPVRLDITVVSGNLSIIYSRDGEVSISAWGKDRSGGILPEEYFKTHLTLEQDGSHITVRSKESVPEDISTVSYRIDVPFRTEINSSVLRTGNQKVIGVTGPAKLTSGEGNIDATYVRFAEVQATTGKGKISCTRVAQVKAETGSGSITLLENGISKAVIKKGPGRIEIGGARGDVEAMVDSGEIHIKAVQDGDWKLSSNSGNIRIELPPRANFEISADTVSGTILIERDGVEKLPESVRRVHQKVNAGGRQIQIHSGSGNIYIQ